VVFTKTSPNRHLLVILNEIITLFLSFPTSESIPMPRANQLEQDILSAIQCKHGPEVDFPELAMRVFCYQFLHNSPYRQYCQSLGLSPDLITQWQDIPAVPTDAFKLHQHPLVTFPADSTHHTFHTSGTTADIKGHHHFRVAPGQTPPSSPGNFPNSVL
jgi:hypothetical protein